MKEKDLTITTPQGKNVVEALQNADTSVFKPVPFWSINSKLEKAEIIRQIKEMHAFGLGGFIFHARTGLVTEYLSEEWFEMVTASLDTAKELGMHVWIYDENGWPSGFVGGKLLERTEYRARYLEYKILDEYDENAYAVYEYNSETGAKLLQKGEKANGKYHTVYIKVSDAYTDILNPALTDLFIEETYEKYYARYQERFGKELIGFFTDEPQYFRWATPISTMTESEYKKQYGKDLKEGLLYLFVQDEKGYPFRVEYYNLMSKLYCENFYKRLYDWCEAHNCLLTGHSVEETSLVSNMWGGADCAISYAYEHIPGIDNLQKACTAEVSAKSVGSTAAQLGKKFVLTETFGVSGYSTTPKQLKIIADKQYVYGVNTMVQHLYHYSLAGQGKIDCPPAFGRAMPWTKGYPILNRYFEKLGFLIAHSEEIAPVAVITPMESVYLDYMRLDEKEARKNVDEPFIKTLNALRSAGLEYQFVNEKLLQKIGSVDGKDLVVGEKRYGAIVLADCRELKANTVAIVKKAVQNGAKLYVSGVTPTFIDGVNADTGLASNCNLGDLPKPVSFTASQTVSYSYRRMGDKNILFFVNEENTPTTVTTKTPFSVLDIVAGEGYRATTVHTVPANGSLLLEENGDYQKPYPEPKRSVALTPAFVGTGKNNLTVERVTVRTEQGEELNGFVYGVFETLAKRDVSGNIRVRFRFESDNARPITITREKQKVSNVRFNGEEISFAQAEEDINFEYADCVAKAGENIYEYEVDYDKLKGACKTLYDPTVPESILNCLTYDTGMEQIYIAGDFDVDGYKLVERKAKTAGNLSVQGYENFYGAVQYQITLPEGVKDAYIKPVGEYSQCILTVDGKKYFVILTEGVYIENIQNREVEIECYSTLRNRIGPFHFDHEIDDGISPDTFTLRGTWKDEKTSSWYCEQKRAVPFGLQEVVVEY